MSVEQAYTIFLDTCNEICLEKYLVYSHLLRAGYFVFEHNQNTDEIKFRASEAREAMCKEDEMVWCVLMEQLNLPVSLNLIEEEPQLYQKTKMEMQLSCEQICGERERDETILKLDYSKAKRDPSPLNEEPLSKRPKMFDDEFQCGNFLDILKSEVEFSIYQETFKKFNFIKKADSFAKTNSNLKFHFDVYSPKAHFKKTEDLPNYRIVVIK